MFIAFEGIDGSGKSSLSKKLAESLDFIWTKEPTFSSETADALNLDSKNDVQREVEFAVDRIRHITGLLSFYDDIVCDRYIWTGLVYCNTYNPSAYPFAEAMYTHEFFRKPDIYIFVDTPVELCFERRKTQSIEDLTKLRDMYRLTKPLIEKKSKIITIQGVGDIDIGVGFLKNELRSLFKNLP